METEGEEEHKVEIVGDDPTCVTFTFTDEDHTLGNALRYVLMKNKAVELCGYSIPHPSDNKMNLRLQTYKKPATQVLHEAIAQLKEMAETIKTKFAQEEDRRGQVPVREQPETMDVS